MAQPLFLCSFAAPFVSIHFLIVQFFPSIDSEVRSMKYWLMKSEPGEVSIDDVLAAPGQTVSWFGVRNYQARNFMRDAMQFGDRVLFYHSSCAQPGVAGLAQVVSAAYPDHTQFVQGGAYFDPKATPEQPRWAALDVQATQKTRLMPLSELRAIPELAEMVILQKGNRLSITPVTARQWQLIVSRLQANPTATTAS